MHVAVVIPARDEAATIAQCVSSLRVAHWPGKLSIIVVDDDSADDTAELALSAGSTEVVRAAPLPRGWTGKVWAMHCGVEAAMPLAPDFLLFTDADIVHGPCSISDLVARAADEQLDLVSVMVRLSCIHSSERLLTPAFVFFFFLLYPPARIASTRWRVAGAAGGCILIRPEVLRKAGGLAAIRDALIDDCALAAVVKRAGGRLRLLLGTDTQSLREYPTVGDMRRMIARSAYTQLKYSPFLLLGCIAGMAFLFGVPLLSAINGSVLGAVSLLIMTALYWPLVRYYRQPPITAFLLPVAAGIYVAATVESAWRYHLRSGAEWKGRYQTTDTHGT